MWTPGVDLFSDALGILRPKRDTVALARALYRIMHDLEVRLPRAKNLVKAIGSEILDKTCHRRGRKLRAVDPPCRAGHVEIGKRAVTVEGDVFRSKRCHGSILFGPHAPRSGTTGIIAGRRPDKAPLSR